MRRDGERPVLIPKGVLAGVIKRGASWRGLKRRIPAIHLPGGDCFQMLLQRMQCAGEAFWPHLPGQGISRMRRMDVGRESELREVSQVRGRGARVLRSFQIIDNPPDICANKRKRGIGKQKRRP